MMEAVVSCETFHESKSGNMDSVKFKIQLAFRIETLVRKLVIAKLLLLYIFLLPVFININYTVNFYSFIVRKR